MKINKCLSKETIQTYIDQELSEEERKLADLHLKLCKECRQSLQELESWSSFVRQSLKEQPIISAEIPDFHEKYIEEKPGTKRRLLPAFIKVAAVFLFGIGGIWWLTREKEKPFQPSEADLIIWESAASGNDANYDWHNPQLPVITESAESSGKINWNI